MNSPLAPKPAEPTDLPVKGRLRTAIELMVHEALPRREAAERAGLTDNALYRALNKPHVMRFKRSVFAAMVNAEAERSVVTMVELRDKAGSEHVRLEAAKHLGALGGVKPPETPKHQRPDAIPGYIIDLTPVQVIEGDASAPGSRRLLVIPSDKQADEPEQPQALDVDFEET